MDCYILDECFSSLSLSSSPYCWRRSRDSLLRYSLLLWPPYTNPRLTSVRTDVLTASRCNALIRLIGSPTRSCAILQHANMKSQTTPQKKITQANLQCQKACYECCRRCLAKSQASSLGSKSCSSIWLRVGGRALEAQNL